MDFGENEEEQEKLTPPGKKLDIDREMYKEDATDSIEDAGMQPILGGGNNQDDPGWGWRGWPSWLLYVFVLT